MFGAVKITKNSDIDKYKYFGYGIGFDRHETSSFPTGGFGQNVIIFGVDLSSSVHVDNKKKDILILAESPTRIKWYSTDCRKVCNNFFSCN